MEIQSHTILDKKLHKNLIWQRLKVHKSTQTQIKKEALIAMHLSVYPAGDTSYVERYSEGASKSVEQQSGRMKAPVLFPSCQQHSQARRHLINIRVL